ncbi:MAG: sterol desaturase [Fibrobacteres bacterium]|nr:sterol desaturase [Fibrobacterota bacterium]
MLAKTLNDIQPILIVAFIILFGVLETFAANVQAVPGRGRHFRRGLVLALSSFSIFALTGLFSALTMDWAETHRFGLVRNLPIPAYAKIALGIPLIDLAGYFLHRAWHRVPWIWRLHRVHHNDPTPDVTTSLRFHPLDLVLQFPVQALVLAVLGVPVLSAAVYFTLSLPLLFSQHANVRWNPRFDRFARIFISSPGYHRMHHSSVRSETDSNFADVFPLWDRLFGTYRTPKEVRDVRYGIDGFEEEDAHRFRTVMLSPFRRV